MPQTTNLQLKCKKCNTCVLLLIAIRNMGVPIYKRTTFLLLVFTQFCYATVSTTAQATRSAKAELILLDVQKYPKARCLDGSPGAFYKNLNPELQFNGTWVIMLQGGGECIDENSCKARSTTALGSSKAMAKNFYFRVSNGNRQ